MTYKVGNPVIVKLFDGRIVEATIKAVIETTEGLNFRLILVMMKRR
jgi:hypothetical protein